MKMFNFKIIILYFTFLIFLPGSVYAVDFFKDEDVIWKAGRNIYFKYSEQDKSYFGNNDHPVELNAEEISKALESLKILEKDGADTDKEQKSVFTSEQINLLSQNLAKGLTNAKPNQDIIFALEKSDNKVLGLIKDRSFVAGRAFFKDEKLNIIIGDYDRPRDKGFEAAYDPTKVGIVSYHFDHGKRSQSSKGFKKTIIEVQGIENKQLKDIRRKDWLVIDLKLMSEASVLKAKMQKEQEMERKRKELKQLLDSEATSPSHPVAVPATTTGSSEERLKTLNQLKDKGLITDEEYAAKRKQILEDL
jgi:hypothetical protein